MKAMETDYHFETGIYRPPSEGGSASLLLRLTRNCPWNHCTFCAMYKTEKFELRSPDEIIGDINTMHTVFLELKHISECEGAKGDLTRRVFTGFFNRHPDLYFHPGISMLMNWFASGGKTVFLQDADSLIMKTRDMVRVLDHLKTRFPAIERITTYARSRTIVKKKFPDLEKIKNAGLDRVHIGLESGDAAVLKTIKKGAGPDDHVTAGKKALDAGFQVSEYWMPGIGGKAMSENHANHTADILNRINPHYIRSRPFTPRPGSPMYEQPGNATASPMTPKDQLSEIRQMLQRLHVSSKVCFDHAGNCWKKAGGDFLLSHSYEGYQFPDEKDRLLGLIDSGIHAYQ